jgi:hypothetical protein
MLAAEYPRVACLAGTGEDEVKQRQDLARQRILDT